jgi:ribosomal protein S18 acetylase RimI-like enzyme
MGLTWVRENGPVWDADKARIVGGAPAGVFDTRYGQLGQGEPVPGEWWRVEDGDRVVGYGWLELVWGDAEILLASDPEARSKGVGSFVLEQLDAVAQERGLNYMTNVVRSTHPDAEQVSGWLTKRGFKPSEDGRLVRRVKR